MYLDIYQNIYLTIYVQIYLIYPIYLENDLGASSSGASTVLNVQYPPSVQISMEPSSPVSETDLRYMYTQIDR